jgi:hypothetical protein
MNATTELLTTDTKGRVRTTPERRAMLLEEFDRSGLSAAGFAKLAGIKYQTFVYWVHRRRESSGKEKPEGRETGLQRQWVEAALEPPGPGEGEELRIELPGGAHVVIASRRQLRVTAELLQVLAGRPGPEVPC